MTTTKNNEHKKLNFSSEREQSQVCLNSAEHEKNQGRKVLNVPNLRFPEFQGEWTTSLLSDYLTENKERNKKGEFDKTDVLSVSGDYGIVNQIELLGRSFAGASVLPYHVVRHGNIVYTKSPLKEYPYGIVKANTGVDGIVSTLYAVYNIKNNVDAQFIEYYFSSANRTNRYFKPIVRIGAKHDMKIGNQEVLANKVTFPNLEEQTKIASLFRFLDERIATQNKIIEDLKKLKCAIIEKLYYKIQGKEYLYRQLFDVVNERNKQMEYSNILSASQEKGMVNRDDLNLDIQFERSNINTYKIVREGDYVIHLRSFQGGFAFSDKLGVCSPAYTILRPNSLLEYGYMSFYFTSQRFIKSLIIVTYGIRDGRSINVEEWLNMKIVVPSKEYQLHTLNVFKSIDDKIVNEEMYATCLSNQKQYLLHNMFI